MKCKFCGSEMSPLNCMRYDIPGRPGHVQHRYDFYCLNRACGASYTYSLMDNNEAMDNHWYDPDPHAPEAPTELQEVPGDN